MGETERIKKRQVRGGGGNGRVDVNREKVIKAPTLRRLKVIKEPTLRRLKGGRG